MTNLIWYMQKAFKPFIKANIKSQVNKYKDWNVLIKKTVITKAKTALQPILYKKKID